MDFLAATLTGGIGFIVADGLDRFLATYNPSAATPAPTNKFTSTGNGTLANTLNVASMPKWARVGAAVGVAAVPALGSVYIKNGLMKSSVEGFAIGASISAFKTLWNNVLMPMLIGKDTSTSTLQKSYIARLYPAEVAASINMKANQVAVSSTGSGALSGAPEVGTGAPDVGPFALADSSPYPTADQALRRATGVQGDSPYPTVASALRQEAGVHGDSPYPTAAAAIRAMTGVNAPWQPGPPPGPGPGPQAAPGSAPSCGCVGDEYASFLGDAQEETLTLD